MFDSQLEDPDFGSSPGGPCLPESAVDYRSGMSVFGEYFRSRREDLGVSQSEAAKRLGVSTTTVARWERGSAVPTSARAAQLRDLLGISVRRIGDLVRGEAPPPGAEATEARIAELEDRIAELEAKCAEPVTTLEDQYGNSITLGPTGICIESSSQVKIDATIVEVTASAVQLDAAMVNASGVVKAATLITNSVISSSYTPGAGNIW
jgi:transcriptional regulator with XRE-family HTH domain